MQDFDPLTADADVIPQAALNPDTAFLAGSGDLGARIAALDWGATPLGPIAGWDACLKTAVSIVLRSNVPMAILWGPEGIMLYNAGYAVIAGAKHPSILGTRATEAWPEFAEFNQTNIDTCLGGDTLCYRDQELMLNRSGVPEQVWMDLDYSPILGADGRPVGVIAVVVETTHKVIAERWRASELDRMRQIFAQAPGFMAMLSGPEHVFEVTNAAYMQLVGHRDVLGKTVRESLPEIAGQGYFELLDQVFQTGKPFIGTSLKAQIQRVPGAPKEDRFLDLVYQPVRNPAGQVIGIFAQGVDVTERLQAEAALRASEARFRTFADAMPNQVWTAGVDGMLNWFNPQVYAYSGAAEGTLDGMGWAMLVHPEDLPNTAAVWAEALKTGIFYQTEFRLRRHDGAYRWHIARAVTISDAEGRVVQWIGNNTDIHDQKAAAEALARSERRFQLSQIAAGISSLELDIATGTVYGTEGFWDLWGLTPRENVHISVLEGIVIPDDAGVRSNQETREAGSATPTVEYRIRRPDTGEVRWLSRSIDFVRDAAGKPVKMFGVLQDITERKASEARQQMLTHELEHRIKNILAMVGAIASQTLRNTDIETGRAVFGERLRALAKAHDLLNDTRWTDASLRQVIESTIAVFAAGQIVLEGPPVSISPKMALSMALAVNELGTNAVKYGALSVPGGRVRVQWETGEALVWRWEEQGGPAVSPPERRGFGTFLVERVLASDFGGTVEIRYHDHGLECVLRAPMPDIAGSDTALERDDLP